MYIFSRPSTHIHNLICKVPVYEKINTMNFCREKNGRQKNSQIQKFIALLFFELLKKSAYTDWVFITLSSSIMSNLNNSMVDSVVHGTNHLNYLEI